MIDPTITEIHRAEFGEPAITVFAPGRVNLIGEYTDFNDGLVLPMPLPMGITVGLSASSDGKLHTVSAQFDGTHIREMDGAASGHWSDYVLGAIQMSGAPLDQGLCISVSSNLPVGASVSSSAALEVATLRALRSYFGLDLDDDAVARLAQKAENEFVGVQCGLMDQMVISVGKPNQALLFDTQDGTTQNHALLAGSAVITLHSGVSRQLKDNAYNDRRASCERACGDMDVASLRLASLGDLEKVTNDDDRAKAMHVIAENARVNLAVEALSNNDMSAFGKIMYDGHASLSELFDVSTATMDAMVDYAKTLGFHGARMTGAGFGGCIVLITTADHADGLIQAMIQKFCDAWVVADMRF